jgi:hypothetical protein
MSPTRNVILSKSAISRIVCHYLSDPGVSDAQKFDTAI